MTRVLIRMVSSAKSGYFYIKDKNTKSKDKLSVRKYDPVVKKHVLFEEKKIK